MKIIVAQNCNCRKPLINFTDKNKAHEAYIKCFNNDELNGHMYWAIHYNGQHILAIEDDSED